MHARRRSGSGIETCMRKQFRQYFGLETTTIGFRAYPEGEMQKIHDLLDGLARSAIGME